MNQNKKCKVCGYHVCVCEVKDLEPPKPLNWEEVLNLIENVGTRRVVATYMKSLLLQNRKEVVGECIRKVKEFDYNLIGITTDDIKDNLNKLL